MSENVDIASQPSRPSRRLRSQDTAPSSDNITVNSLRQLHGSEAPVFSDDPDPAVPPQGPLQRQRSRLIPDIASSASSVKTPTRKALFSQGSTSCSNTRSRKSQASVGKPKDKVVHPPHPPHQHDRQLSVEPRPAAGPSKRSRSPAKQRNASAGPSRTHDHFTEESGFAVPAPLPLDPRKRQRQEDSFRSVQPIKAGGPYGYYNLGNAGEGCLRSAMAALADAGPSESGPSSAAKQARTSQLRSQAKSSFKTPFLKPPEKTRKGTTSVRSLDFVRSSSSSTMIPGRP